MVDWTTKWGARVHEEYPESLARVTPLASPNRNVSDGERFRMGGGYDEGEEGEAGRT